jgi:hypothetical protein
MIEQAELTWFITQGIAVFERSTTGDILDKLDRDAHVSRECPICDGNGIILEQAKKRCSAKIAWVRAAKIGDWCKRCNGVGQIPMRLSPEEQSLVDSGEWATSSDHEGTRSTVPDAILCRYANVSRTLSKMPIRLRDALMAGYGDEGEELAATLHGRAWACAYLTKAGAELLRKERERRTRVEGIEPERPIRCLTDLARLNGHQSNPDRTKLLSEASTSSVRLLKKAEDMWEAIIATESKAA